MFSFRGTFSAEPEHLNFMHIQYVYNPKNSHNLEAIYLISIEYMNPLQS